MRPRRVTAAFSLVEVVLATALFAVGVTAVLALLPTFARQSADGADAMSAGRLQDSLRIELRRLAASGGFDALATGIPEMGASPIGMEFVAARDGLRLHAADYLAPSAPAGIPVTEQYFAVELWRMADAPLRYDPTGATLAICARVSWPFRNPGAVAATPLAERQQLLFVVSLTR